MGDGRLAPSPDRLLIFFLPIKPIKAALSTSCNPPGPQKFMIPSSLEAFHHII